MSHRSGIPSVKTTHGDSSPTTETHREKLLFSSSSLSTTSSYNLIPPFFPFISLSTFFHSATCSPSSCFLPVPFFHRVSVSLHFPQHWSLIQAGDKYKFIIRWTPANPLRGCDCLTHYVNPFLSHPPKCGCQLIHHFITTITSPSLLVAKRRCPQMQITPAMHVCRQG